MTNITVFGTGSFGTALANVLADNGHNTLMWGKTSTTIDEINHEHTNHNYLKGVTLNSTIQATTDIQTAIDHSDIYLIALPTKAIREVMSQVNQLLISKNLLFMLLKGLRMQHLSVFQKCWKTPFHQNITQALAYFLVRVMPKKWLSNNRPPYQQLQVIQNYAN